jgi:mannosyl-oligosaccharide alpha-1,2-mannosidase
MLHATVDAHNQLDTLWIMDMKVEFEEALSALDKIDFTSCSLDLLNVFETTIRYLGGFIAAYDLTDGKYPSLLAKATELGEMLYVAFDTPNRMPMTHWNFRKALAGEAQVADETVLIAEIGSLTLEFTRLSQLTGDPKYFDAVQRIMQPMDEQQQKTNLPGIWPVLINARTLNFTTGVWFSLGGMADSAFEYLPKQHMLLGGATEQYKNMYERSLAAMKEYLFYRPMLPDMNDILFPGQVISDGKTPLDHLQLEPQAQHLDCYLPGMVAIGAKLFQSDSDLAIAKKLVEGCLWGYEAGPNGMMPEIFHFVSCAHNQFCNWDERLYNQALTQSYEGRTPPPPEERMPGVTKIDDTRYILRPEAIESIFIMYRITGDTTYQDRAWKMFEDIIKHTKTNIAHAAVIDCTVKDPPLMDSMESFWLAETLKYFYLIFADEELVNLDHWVLNTG